MSSAIEWTDETWNPTVGCREVSPGCDHCNGRAVYVERVGKKAAGRLLDGRTWDEIPGPVR